MRAGALIRSNTVLVDDQVKGELIPIDRQTKINTSL